MANIIDQILHELGMNQSTLARNLKVTRASISLWKKYNTVPRKHCETLENMLKNVGSNLTRVNMREDWRKWWPHFKND